MMMSGRVAIVTGAGRGIGRSIAEHFLGVGAAVVIAEIDAAAGKRAAKELARRGQVLFVKTDVAAEPSVRRMVARTVAVFGRIDFLVNNAATACGRRVTELTAREWRRVLDVNLTGPFLCAKHAAAHLARTRGAIVNIGSTRALMSEANTEAYSASKGGLVALTHALAVSLGPDVRVNCISPGWIASRKSLEPRTERDHRQHPAGRAGMPPDVAAMVLYLCSQAAGFITGQNFVVDGGMTKKMIYEE